MLRNEVMASRHVGNHRTRCDRLGNDPPLLLVAPPSAAHHARHFRAAPNNLRVVTDVDHNVHKSRDHRRIAIMHARVSLHYVGVEHRLLSLPGLTGQSSTPGRWLLDRPVKPGDDSEVRHSTMIFTKSPGFNRSLASRPFNTRKRSS